jgi:hypothetical protein
MALGEKVKIFRSIDAIGRESINSIASDAFFSYEWLKTLESQQEFSVGRAPIYFAAYSEGKLIAFVPSFIQPILLEKVFYQYFCRPKLQRYILPYLNRMLILSQQVGLSQDRMLISSSPFSCSSKVLINMNSEKTHILNLLLEKIDVFCKKEKFMFNAFLFVSEFDKLLMDNLPTVKYSKSPGLTTSYLDVRWTSFEDYLKAFNCKVRKNIKREIRKSAENGVSIEELESGDIPEFISESTLNFSRNNKNVCVASYSSFFSKLNEYAKDSIKIFVAKKNNKKVGFSLNLRKGDILDTCFAGFSYDVLTNTDFVFYNVCYYAPIRWAIEEGIKRVYFRDGAVDMMAHRGCKLEKTYAFVKCYDRLLGPLINSASLTSFRVYLNQRL